VLAACAAWSVASPLFAFPDEGSHLAQAESVARGELHGRDRLSPIGLLTRVHLTGTLLKMRTVSGCFVNKPTRTADCVPSVSSDGRQISVWTQSGRYPPLYFGIVGAPLVAWPDGAGIGVGRTLSVVMGAALIATAFWCAQRLGRWALLGVLVACTPMVLYLPGGINPNGLEIAACLAVWAGACSLARAPAVDERLLATSCVVFAIAANVRGFSLLFAGVALGLPLLLATRERMRDLWHLPRARGWLALLPLGAMPAIAWPLWLGFDQDRLHTRGLGLLDGIERTRRLWVESVASFGWSEVEKPSVAWLWLVLFLAVAAMALIGATRREALVLATAGLVAVAVPITISMLNIPPLYFVWQGRYGLPLTVGIPVVAATIACRTRAWNPPERRAFEAVAALVVLGQAYSFWVVARRYSVGAEGRLLFFLDPRWSPPVPMLALLVVYVAALAVLAWWVVTADTVDDFRTSRPAAAQVA
jgi:hypothetical protein